MQFNLFARHCWPILVLDELVIFKYAYYLYGLLVLSLVLMTLNVVMGPGQKFLARVGSGLVSHLWFEFGFGKSGQKISLGLVKKYPGQRCVGLLFTAGLK